MKPDWDKLMGEFSGNPSVLIADVDCTEGGKDLCEKQGVEGFPTLKYGDPDDLKKYQGGRTFADLKSFAEANLGPQCGPGENLHLCSDKVKAKIEKFMKMSATELQEKIDKAHEKVKVDLPLMNKAKAYVEKQGAGGDAAKEGKTDLYTKGQRGCIDGCRCIGHSVMKHLLVRLGLRNIFADARHKLLL
jgi:hypothetical protein